MGVGEIWGKGVVFFEEDWGSADERNGCTFPEEPILAPPQRLR